MWLTRLIGLVAAMKEEEVKALGWERKLPLALEESVGELEKAIQNHSLDDLGDEFLRMFVDFKKLEAEQSKKKSEEERLTLREIY